MNRKYLLASVAVLAVAQASRAAIYLSGAVSYVANGTGSSISEPAEFDNIVGTGNSELVINRQARGTTFALAEGANDFAYSGVFGGWNALSYYFDTSPAAFGRPFASAPDLAAYGFDAPLTPVAGALVQTNGQFSGLSAYAGNSAYVVDGMTVAVTGFTSANVDGRGTFQITLSVPEPAPVAFGAALAPLALLRRRR